LNIALNIALIQLKVNFIQPKLLFLTISCIMFQVKIINTLFMGSAMVQSNTTKRALVMPPATAALLVKRLIKAYQLKDITALSKALGYKVRTIKGWLKNGKVPLAVVFRCHDGTGVSLDWLTQDVQSTGLLPPGTVDGLHHCVSKTLTGAVNEGLIAPVGDAGISTAAVDLSQWLLQWLQAENVWHSG
jgi:hypothetical protein